jgi:hypothetical protein
MRNKSTFAFYTFLFSLCVSLCSFNKTTAQEKGIYELSETNSLARTSSKKANLNDREDFYALALNLHATIYVENNSLRKSNKNITSASKLTFNDAKSFNILNQNNQDFSDVELITIVLNSESDLNNKINLTQANGFNSLKYVYIKCNFKCSEQQLKSFVTSDAAIRVFYKSETPS